MKTTDQLIAGDANGRVTVAGNTYNEIGQLVDKKLHKTPLFDYLQSVDYTYNIRGWLTAINNPDNLSVLQPGDPNLDLFGEKLLYNTSGTDLNSVYKQQFNGNISAMVWKTADKNKQGYAFTYDGLNRLTSSDHQSCPATAWLDDGNYEERLLPYDQNGNIKGLIRTNSVAGNIADYTYNYSGNKLTNITTSGIINGVAYAYDLNGNTTTDGLRNVSIAYNILNLPKLVSKGTDNISYIYSAAGEKLAKKMKDNTYQYYAGNMVYKNDKSLNYLLFEEGLVTKTSTVFSYEYHLKDHLGNTRVAFQPNGSGGTTTTQVAEYYPFGSSYLPMSPAGTNKYLYNGKEKQDDILSGTALDLYDYGARFYDPIIGRFHTQDRFAEKYLALTPYQYGANNPINYIDFNGDSIVWTTTGKETTQAQAKIAEMRNKSKSFDALMKNLESLKRIIKVGVSDKKVEETAKKDGLSEEQTKNAQGYSSEGTSIFFRANASLQAFSEEMFHQFQFSIYGRNRNSSEKDAEAKLLNFTVEDEYTGGAIGIDLSINFWKISGKEVTGENLKIYNTYLKAFEINYKSIPNHPYGKYTIRLLPPAAYNKLMQLKSK